MKVLTIGAAMRDLFIEHDRFEVMQVDQNGSTAHFILIPEGKKTEVEKIMNALGGGALNSALSFQRLGFSASCFAKIGNDLDGINITDTLQRNKVNTKNIVVSAKGCTGMSCILPSPSGDRGILVYRGVNLLLTAKEIPKKAIEQTDCVYITSLSGKTAKLLVAITAHAKKHKKIVACNPGTSQLTVNVSSLKKSLKNIDILVMNSDEATLLMKSLGKTEKSHAKSRNKKLPVLLAAPISSPTGCFTLQNYFHEVCLRGPKIVVVTNGPDGVYVWNGTEILYHPSLPIDVISTVGAGDAFSSTFVAYLLANKSIEDAIKAGIINSASVIQTLDANSGLLSRKELDSLCKENKIHLFRY